MSVPVGRPYRILHSVSDLHVGGVARLLLRNISNMDQGRFENHVCYLVPRRDLEPSYARAGFVPVCLDHRRKWHGGRTLLRLIKLLRQRRIDLVHTNHPLDRLYLGLAAFICRVPVVTTLHSTAVPADITALRHRLRVWITDRTGSIWTRRFIAVSKAVRDIGTRYGNAPRDRVSVLYSGVPINHVEGRSDPASQERLRRELGLNAAYPVLINVARLTEVKGQVSLVRMMPQVLERWPQARLIIVGEGEQRAALEAAIERQGLGSCIHLLGQRSDVHDLLAVSDVFLFPSLSEGLPLALLEAAAARKPVVASKCGPMMEVVEDGASGYLVAPGDPHALAEGVLGILESPERARRMGERGRCIVEEKFNLHESVRALERFYLSTMEKA